MFVVLFLLFGISIIMILMNGGAKRRAYRQERKMERLIKTVDPNAQSSRIDDLRQYGPFAAMVRSRSTPAKPINKASRYIIAGMSATQEEIAATSRAGAAGTDANERPQ
jgi:hypothetical protein